MAATTPSILAQAVLWRTEAFLAEQGFAASDPFCSGSLVEALERFLGFLRRRRDPVALSDSGCVGSTTAASCHRRRKRTRRGKRFSKAKWERMSSDEWDTDAPSSNECRSLSRPGPLTASCCSLEPPLVQKESNARKYDHCSVMKTTRRCLTQPHQEKFQGVFRTSSGV